MLYPEDYEDGSATRATVFAWWIWGVLVAFFCLGLAMLFSGSTFAAAIGEARNDEARVVIYNDPCKLDAVANLPYRATWDEKGKIFEGCWGGRPEAGLVVAYFDDKTVAIIPINSFVRVLSL